MTGNIQPPQMAEGLHLRNRSGLTLIGIIVAIVVMGLLGAGVLMLVSTGSMESIQTLKSGRSFCAAESGVSAARAYMATNVDWYTNSSAITGTVGQASFSAILDTHGGITSVGSKDEVRWTSIWRPTWHAMLVYGTSTNVGTPKYRIWGGTNWSAPSNTLSVGAANINWVVVKACPRRNEYVAATLDTTNGVKAQVYRDGSWSNLQTIATVDNAAYRGVDIAYETLSGDAMVVAANNAPNVTCYVWDGDAWSAPVTISLPRGNKANWVKLASDPVSDEIIVMVQDAARWYTAAVWNGAAWGNVKLPATRSPGVQYESMAMEYETSGSQAIIVSANGIAASFKWSSWNGTTWSSEGTTSIGDDFYWGTLVNDPNSDNLLLTYIDTDNDIGKVFWNGSSWMTYIPELETSGNSDTARPVQGQFETLSGHEGHALVVYSDTTYGRSRHAVDPSGATWDTEVSVSTIRDSSTVQTRRTGDGKMLGLFFDDVNDRYDFSWHDGTVWSTMQTLETAPSVTVAPFKEPFMMAPQLWVLP